MNVFLFIFKTSVSNILNKINFSFFVVLMLISNFKVTLTTVLYYTCTESVNNNDHNICNTKPAECVGSLEYMEF